MFQVFSATDSREHDYAEGVGNYWQGNSTSKGLTKANDKLTRIGQSPSMTVVSKPLAGIFKCKSIYPPIYADNN